MLTFFLIMELYTLQRVAAAGCQPTERRTTFAVTAWREAEISWQISGLFSFYASFILYVSLPLVLWRCWLGNWPVKSSINQSVSQ